jgi:hypothetical protein
MADQLDNIRKTALLLTLNRAPDNYTLSPFEPPLNPPHPSTTSSSRVLTIELIELVDSIRHRVQSVPNLPSPKEAYPHASTEHEFVGVLL